MNKELLVQLKEIDESDFKVWLEHPITMILIADIKERHEATRASITENLAFTAEAENRTHFDRGSLVIYKQLLSYGYNEFNYLRNQFLEKEAKNEVNTDRHNVNSRN